MLNMSSAAQKFLFSLLFTLITGGVGVAINVAAKNRGLEDKLLTIEKEKKNKKEQVEFMNNFLCQLDSINEVRLENYTPDYSANEVLTMVGSDIKIGFSKITQELKSYIQAENIKQENMLLSAYFLDDDDSTYRWFYNDVNDTLRFYIKIYLTEDEFNNLK